MAIFQPPIKKPEITAGVVHGAATPLSGGTDGSKISFMGIPTPNVFTGADNMHSRFEFADVNTMEKATDLVIEIAKLLGEEAE